MEFCPTCGNMLQYEAPNVNSKGRFFCPTCPYVCEIVPNRKIKIRQPLTKKQIEPIFSGADAMKSASKTEEKCPSCGGKEAYFHQVQTRSADEPSTIFYTCCDETCGYNWVFNG